MTGTITYQYEDEELGIECELEIDYDATPGRPGQKYDRYGDPGNPPEPGEMHITEMRLVSDHGLKPHEATRLISRAGGWMYTHGYDEICALCWEDVTAQLEDNPCR